MFVRSRFGSGIEFYNLKRHIPGQRQPDIRVLTSGSGVGTESQAAARIVEYGACRPVHPGTVVTATVYPEGLPAIDARDARGAVVEAVHAL